MGHALTVDLSIAFMGGAPQEYTQGLPLSFGAIISTDGMVRWYGQTEGPAFEAMLDRILKVDPAVQARRKVEAEYIRKHGQ